MNGYTPGTNGRHPSSETDWRDAYRRFLYARFDRLNEYLEELKRKREQEQPDDPDKPAPD